MKKIILSVLLTLFVLTGFATNYYMDAVAGVDGAGGTSTGTAWKSITYLNSRLIFMVTGDSVLFKADQVFYGAVSITKAGIKFAYYGIGAKPNITGYTTVAGWVQIRPGVYAAPLNAPNDLRLVTLDGVPTERGRTPNKNQGIASYFYAEGYNNGTIKSITDRQLTGTPNLTGRHMMIKGQTWALGEVVIISHSDTVLNYRVGRPNLVGNGQYYRPPTRTGTGYILVGDDKDVDQPGEFAYDTVGRRLIMCFGAENPNMHVVQAATLDNAFDIGAQNGISIEGLQIGGYNRTLVYARNGGGNLKVKNCDLNGAGARGVMFSNTPSIIIEDNTVRNILSTPLRLPTNQVSGASIQRNILTNNCPHETSFYNAEDLDGDAIACGMNNSIISFNFIDGSGYMGIWFTGSNVRVEGNEITHWALWLNDDGAIYTHALTGRGSFTIHVNRIVINNWIHDATGYRYGFTSLSSAACKGLYSDDQAMNILYIGNVVYNVDIGCSNNLVLNVSFFNNIILARRGVNFSRKSYSQITNFQFRSNIVLNILTPDITYYYLNDSLPSGNILNAITGHQIDIDSNISNLVSGNVSYGTETYSTDEPALKDYKQTLYNLANWRTTTGLSAHDVLVPFLPFAETGRKLVINWGTPNVSTQSLNGKYREYAYDGNGTLYNGSIVLQPYTVKLVFYVEPVTPPTTPAPARIKIRGKF